MEAGNNNGPDDLGRVFAPMLSELEDHATRLTTRQAELLRELNGVNEELERVESVRAAMLGKRGPGRPKKPTTPVGVSGTTATGTSAKQTRERAERVMAYAREHGREFTAREASGPLGVSYQGLGPTLAGMVRKGQLEVREDPNSRTNFYSLPA